MKNLTSLFICFLFIGFTDISLAQTNNPLGTYEWDYTAIQARSLTMGMKKASRRMCSLQNQLSDLEERLSPMSHVFHSRVSPLRVVGNLIAPSRVFDNMDERYDRTTEQITDTQNELTYWTNAWSQRKQALMEYVEFYGLQDDYSCTNADILDAINGHADVRCLVAFSLDVSEDDPCTIEERFAHLPFLVE